MEKKKWIQVMKNSISDVFEKMFFELVQFMESDISVQEWLNKPDIKQTSILITGPQNIQFSLFIPNDALKELSIAFLGIEEDQLDTQKIDDTFKEILNMITGRTISQLDSEGQFHLGIPQIETEVNIPQDGEIILFETEKDHMALCITFE